MPATVNIRKEFQRALTGMIAQFSRIPVLLYEFEDGQPENLTSPASFEIFEPHCKLIQSFPGGKRQCEIDQCKRASISYSKSEESLAVCHAGLWNQAVPIKISGETRVVLLYGQFQLAGESYHEQSLAKHQQVAAKLGLNDEQAAQLRGLLFSAKRCTIQQLDAFKEFLSQMERWLYVVVDEESKAKNEVELIAHELQTRLQATIAHAENLKLEICSLSAQEAAKMADRVLHSAFALDTVVQNLGNYLEDYHFERQSILTIVNRSKQLYEPEASRRGIGIYVSLDHAEDPNRWVDVSRRHLQYTLNNLVHNAVKYSFWGDSSRRRYVEIKGEPEANYYQLTISNYGVGILPEELDKIFKDGYQGKLTQGEFRTGSGKGLHFVNRMIKAHNGRIKVESKLLAEERTPEGKPHLNRFTILLPYHQPKKAPGAK